MNDPMMSMLEEAVRPHVVRSFADAAGWWADHRIRTATFDAPIDRAIVGALSVDRVAWAFAGGYLAALQHMIPSLGRDGFASLAATEEGGAHPRAIQTTFDGDVLRGHKRWVTLPGEARGPSSFYVVAQRGTQTDARPQLVLTHVRSDAANLTIERTSAPFVPELAHAELTLDGVKAEALPGDGYADYLKPFRTIEDLHVHGAMAALALGLAQRIDAPKPPRERLLATLVVIRGLALADPKSSAVHLALGGVITTVADALGELEPAFRSLDAATLSAWERDRVLFGVAAKARAARLASAWAGAT
jgi:hypothetical protein